VKVLQIGDLPPGEALAKVVPDASSTRMLLQNRDGATFSMDITPAPSSSVISWTQANDPATGYMPLMD